MKNKNQQKQPPYVKLAHQPSFRNVNLKLDHHTGGKWFIHGPKHRKENKLLSLKHSDYPDLLCEYDIKEVHGN